MQGLAIPYLQVRSNTIYQYNQSDMAGKFCRTIQSLLSKNIAWQYDAEGTVIKQNYSGRVTVGAKKRLTRAIENLVQCTPYRDEFNFADGDLYRFKLSFITLTITDNLPINEAGGVDGKTAYKKLLAPFLRWMREKHNVKAYVWKAEIQDKSRNVLHYHITSDAHIYWEDIRYKWNSLQTAAGYNDEYFKKNGHRNSNSVDIHAVKDNSDTAGYLVKEIVKNFQNNFSIGGKVWDCSLNLKTAKYYTTVADSVYENKINWALRYGIMHQLPCVSDHCRIFRMSDGRPASVILNKTDKREYKQYMDAVRCKDLDSIREFKPTRKKQVTDFQPETWYSNNQVQPVELITKKAIQFTFNRGEVDIGFRVETALHCSN